MSYVCLIHIIGTQCFMNHVADLEKHDARIQTLGGFVKEPPLRLEITSAGLSAVIPPHGTYINALLLQIVISTFPTPAQLTTHCYTLPRERTAYLDFQDD